MRHEMKLGRIHQDVPANAPSLSMHAIASVTAPPKLIRDSIRFQPRMFSNQLYGNCAWAGIGNALLAQTALAGYPGNVADGAPLQWYEEATGFNPADSATDKGTVLIQGLDYQVKKGLDGGDQTKYVGLWASVDPSDLNRVRTVMALLGVGYWGVRLSVSDQNQDVLDINPPASAGDPTPGSWGDHCLLGWAYDGIGSKDLVTLGTWGTLQIRATWDWVRERLMESHALVHTQLLPPNGKNFLAIDRDTLAADCAAFSA